MMYRPYWLPGTVVSIIFFLAGNLLNLSISYMGNSNSDISSVMIKLFWPTILGQIVKVFVITVLTGIFFNIIYRLAFDFIQVKTGRKFSGRWVAGVIVYSFLMFFLATVINIPQLFMDNFFSKSVFLNTFLDFITGTFSPSFFYSLFYLVNVSAVLMAAVFVIGKVMELSQIRAFLENRRIAGYIPTRRRAAFFVLLISIAGLLIAVIPSKKHIAGKNILIISSDSVRPDRISYNGYSRKTTPNLDKYMKEALQIRGVMTAVPRTFPAWVSLLTSSTPLRHDIGHMFPRTRERSVKLDSAVSYLRNKGYYTSVVSEFAGDIFPRVDLGYENVVAPEMNFKVIIKQVILERQVFLLPFILNRAGRALFPEVRDIAKFSDPSMLTSECMGEIEKSGDRPFFISVFYSITHFPFSGNYPYYKKFSDPDYNGPYKYLKQIVVKLGKGDDSGKKERTSEDPKKKEADEAQVNALYDGCLYELDVEIGRIVEYLKKNGLYENTTIIVTSDHGENLYDEKNYGIGHGEHLRGNYAMEIPFIMLGGYVKDGHRGVTINKTGSITDILPTVFNYTGLGIPGFFRGRDLFYPSVNRVDAYVETGIWFDNNKSSELFFYHERIDYPDISGLLEIDFDYMNEGVVKQEYQNVIKTAKHRAIYSGRYKLIYVPLSSGVRFELYDFVKDPGNRTDLSSRKPDVLGRMKKLFYDYVTEESLGNYKRVGDYILPFYSDSVF